MRDTAGRGGTAPVFTVDTPDGPRALKLYDAKYSQGELGRESEARLKPQLDLGLHDCPYLVRVHDGGRFEDRLFILMDKADGRELEKCLSDIPRDKIRNIVSQVAEACIFLRQKGLTHRDIKSANIFITDTFDRITLLDLSVLRDVYDPVGTGTDHGGELPVVATSRYTPPEYLFRLIPADEHLWHAVDIYQLGGLLHDLIMREPMFEQEYKRTRDTNRYRFAWIVATQDPVVQAGDVDPDLVLTARRALDKDWQRRSQLQLEHFLNDAASRRASGLEILGLSVRTSAATTSRASVQKRMGQLCDALEAEIAARLREHGITTEHRAVQAAQDEERLLCFAWEPPSAGTVTALTGVRLNVQIRRTETAGGVAFATQASLSGSLEGHEKTATLALPSVADVEGDPPSIELATALFGVLPELGSILIRTM